MRIKKQVQNSFQFFNGVLMIRVKGEYLAAGGLTPAALRLPTLSAAQRGWKSG